jgi:hypothetical protein
MSTSVASVPRLHGHAPLWPSRQLRVVATTKIPSLTRRSRRQGEPALQLLLPGIAKAGRLRR